MVGKMRRRRRRKRRKRRRIIIIIIIIIIFMINYRKNEKEEEEISHHNERRSLRLSAISSLRRELALACTLTRPRHMRVQVTFKKTCNMSNVAWFGGTVWL